MKRTLIAGIVAAGFLITGPAFADARKDAVKAQIAEVSSDVLWLKYYEKVHSNRPNSSTENFKNGGMKEAYRGWVYEVTSQCNVDLHQCQKGWDLFKGKGTPEVKTWVRDVMEFAKWGGSTRGHTETSGQRFVSKISHDYDSIARSAIGLALFRFNDADAAGAIAKTLAGPQEIADLYRGCRVPYGVRALWLQGAAGKAHAPTMLSALKLYEKRCDRKQLSWMLPVLDTWTLTPAQTADMETFCSEKVWQEDIGTTGPTIACLRYMGAIGSKSSDVREHVANFAQGNDNGVRVEGIRTAGRLGVKSVKAFLQARVAKAYNKTSTNVRKGKKYVKKYTDTWRTSFDATGSAVALFGMGDKTAAKAIAFWLSFRDSNGGKDFMDNKGFKEVARELAFAHPKVRKKLTSMTSKAFKAGLKHASKKPGMHRDLFGIAIGLSHVGDKAALTYLMNVLKGSDKNAIRELLQAWGGEPDQMLRLGRSTVGLGRFPVGPGLYSAADAEAVMSTIAKRLKFWRDAEMKQDGIATVLSIRAVVAAAKL